MESDNPTTSEVINSLLFNQNISIRLRFPGVYFFAHIPSGMKYVGSSNSLSRRLSSYFNLHDVFYNRGTGLLLPLMQKDGFSAFTLEIFVMPPKFSSEYYYCFLEQYFLLDKKFNLNTHRIVNFSTGQGIKIFGNG